MVHTAAHFARLSHGYLGQDFPRFHLFPNSASIIASVGQQDVRLRKVVDIDQIEPNVIGYLARRNSGSHGQTCCIDTEVDLDREATSRTANTCCGGRLLRPLPPSH